MFNLNTVQGKRERIKRISDLIIKVAEVKGDQLSYDESQEIKTYLLECQRDLQKQLKGVK